MSNREGLRVILINLSIFLFVLLSPARLSFLPSFQFFSVPPLRSSRPFLALDALPLSAIDRTRSFHPLPLSARACVWVREWVNVQTRNRSSTACSSSVRVLRGHREVLLYPCSGYVARALFAGRGEKRHRWLRRKKPGLCKTGGKSEENSTDKERGSEKEIEDRQKKTYKREREKEHKVEGERKGASISRERVVF